MRFVLRGIALGLAFVSLTAQSQPASDGLEVEGLRGQIPRAAVSRTVGARMDDLIACATRRRDDNDMLSGRVTLAFVVARDGTARVSRIAASDLGDRTAEQCMTAIGASLRFPAPTGGEADVSETIVFPLDADVRPPLEWTASRVRATLGSRIDALGARCRLTTGTVSATLYVGRGGRVITSGAFSSTPANDAKVGCVLQALNGLTYPDPGSYPAKVTLEVTGRG